MLSLLSAITLATAVFASPLPQAGGASSTVEASSASSVATSSASIAASSSSVASASSSASAASPSSSASSYLTGLVNAISARDAPTLAGIIANNSAIANALGSVLSSGAPYTLIAPSDPGLNAALAGVDTSNTTLITELLSYHLIPGNYTAESLGVNTTTIPETAINEALVFYRNQYLTTHIVGGQNVTILANSTYENVLIKLADNALHLPTNISSTWMTQQPDSQLLTTLSSVLPSFVNTLDTSSMLTVFAPSNQAIANVESSLAALASNPSQLQQVLEGHIINGTVVYSTNLTNGATTQSAAGTTISVITNSTGDYVMSQGTTAKIIEANIITSNGQGKPGVVHIIDAVLVPPSNQTSAAGASGSSASASAAPMTSASAAASSAAASSSASASA